MKISKLYFCSIITLLTLVTATDSTSAIETGVQAPDFTLQTHDGKRFTLSKLQGKRGAVLVFFATWCPGCMEEVSHIKKFVEKTKGKKILVYGVNLQQPLRIVKKFVASYQVNYRILLDLQGKAALQYGVTGIPYIVGIDGNGKIIYTDFILPKNQDKFIKQLTMGITKKAKKNN